MPHVNSRTPVRRRRVPIAADAPFGATAAAGFLPRATLVLPELRAHTFAPPGGVTGQQRTRSWQAILMRLYVLGVSLRATAASLEVLGCFVSPASLWRDVQRRQAEAPWDSAAKLPGVVLLDET